MKKLDGRNIFVTGGAGFVGSNLTELMVNAGANVTVYDNLSSGRYELISHLAGRKNFTFIKGDLLDTKRLAGAMRGRDIDAVVHLAANPNIVFRADRANLDFEQGTVATHNLLDEARRRDVNDILFSSSSAVYGMAVVRPTPEGYGPLAPISLYGASKLACEGMITAYSSIFGMDYYIYRFANVVGRNLTHGVVLDFMRKLRENPRRLVVLGDGMQRKSYIDVADCVNAMIHVYTKSNRRGNIYNLSADGQVSVNEMARMLIARVAKGARIVHTGGRQGWPGDVPNVLLSNKKIKESGFAPRLRTSRAAVASFVDSLTT